MKQIGMVIQGEYKNNFTLENIIKYKHNYPNLKICLSIWEGDYIKENELNKLKHMENVYILFNKKPSNSGVQNVNYQIYSTLQGIKKLRELGCNLVIKTRTDHFFDLKKLLSIDNYDKIIALETDDLINSPFLVCDFLFYGKIELINELFDIPLSIYGDNRKVFNDKFINIHKYIFYYKIAIENRFELYAERYIIINFLKKKGYVIPRNSILARLYSIILITKYFRLINAQDIKYFTLKRYDALKYQRNSYKYYKNLIDRNKLIIIFYKVFQYEMKEILRKKLFYPKFLFQIWKIK